MQNPTQSPLSASRPAPSSVLARSALFVYGLLAYAIGVAGLLALILACLGLLPFTGGPLALDGPAAVVLNLALVAAFAVQHVVMARPAFKQRWRRRLPQGAERPAFVLLAGALMGAIVWLWQPLPGELWSLEAPAAVWSLRALALAGWSYLFLASFAIDHFELFGLKQSWQTLRGREITPVRFVRRWMYRFDRHPIMSGMLIGLWCTPHMGLDRLLLAAALTVYIVLGVAIEERDLIRAHGDSYRRYVREVSSLVPRLGARA